MDYNNMEEPEEEIDELDEDWWETARLRQANRAAGFPPSIPIIEGDAGEADSNEEAPTYDGSLVPLLQLPILQNTRELQNSIDLSTLETCSSSNVTLESFQDNRDCENYDFGLIRFGITSPQRSPTNGLNQNEVVIMDPTQPSGSRFRKPVSVMDGNASNPETCSNQPDVGSGVTKTPPRIFSGSEKIKPVSVSPVVGVNSTLNDVNLSPSSSPLGDNLTLEQNEVISDPTFPESFNIQHDNHIRPPTSPTESRSTDRDSIVETTKLDGIMIVGKTWNIVAIDGTVSLFEVFKVKSEAAIYYKGLPDAMDAVRRYEILIAIVDNCTLSLLVTSTNPIPKQRVNEVIYKDLVKRFREIILNAMEETQCESWVDHNVSRNKRIVITRADWEMLGPMVGTALQKECLPDEEIDPEKCKNRVFPHKGKICFLLKKFGHDDIYGPNLNPNPYPHVQRQHVERLIVHVAKDYTMEGRMLFFNDSFSKPLGISPTHKYNVGAIPQSSNYTYMKLPPNDKNVLCVQQYNRLYHAIHRNDNDYFNQPKIARSIMEAYISKLNANNAWRKQTELAVLRTGILNIMFNGIKMLLQESQLNYTRYEYVWSYELSESDREIEEDDQSIIPLIHSAFNDVNTFQLEKRMHYPNVDFTSYGKDRLLLFQNKLIETLFNTLIFAVQKLEKFLAVPLTEDLYSTDYQLSLQDFADMIVAEGCLRRILRGDFGHFPKALEACIDNSDENCNMHWPFDTKKIWRSSDGNVLKSSFRIHEVHKDFAQTLGGTCRNMDMMQLITDFKAWMSIPTSSQRAECQNASLKLFTTVSHTIINCLLAINKLYGDQQTSLINLWKDGKAYDGQKFVPVPTYVLFKNLTETSLQNTPRLAPIIYFLRHIRESLTARYKGGTQLTLAMAMDKLICVAGRPFALRIPGRVQIMTFLPSLFVQAMPKHGYVYHEAFEAVHKRSIGARGIPARKFIDKMCDEIATIHVDDRPRNFERLFELINKLLDSTDVTNSRSYASAEPYIRDKLLQIEREKWAVPTSAPARLIRKSIHQPLLLPLVPREDESRRLTRAEVKKLREQAKLEAAQDEVLREFLGDLTGNAQADQPYQPANEIEYNYDHYYFDNNVNWGQQEPEDSTSIPNTPQTVVRSHNLTRPDTPRPQVAKRRRCESPPGTSTSDHGSAQSLSDYESESSTSTTTSSVLELRNRLQRRLEILDLTPCSSSSSSSSTSTSSTKSVVGRRHQSSSAVLSEGSNDNQEVSFPTNIELSQPTSFSSQETTTTTGASSSAGSYRQPRQRIIVSSRSSSIVSGQCDVVPAEQFRINLPTPPSSTVSSASGESEVIGYRRRTSTRRLSISSDEDSDGDVNPELLYPIINTSFPTPPVSPTQPSSSGSCNNINRRRQLNNLNSDHSQNQTQDEDESPMMVDIRQSPSSVLSVCSSSSTASGASRGGLFNYKRSFTAGTPFDSFVDDLLNEQETATKKTPSRAAVLYSTDETLMIFNFLSTHKYMCYMYGLTVYELMVALKMTARSVQSLHSHVKTVMEKRPKEDVRQLLGNSLYREAVKARAKIKATARYNILDKDEVFRRFGVDL